MKPNNENGKLPPKQRPFRVLILAGSNRRQYNCQAYAPLVWQCRYGGIEVPEALWRCVEFVRAKGKVPPGRHRAYGCEAPAHRMADAKLKWRELRMKWSRAPEGSSPQKQDDLALNRDTGLDATLSEGDKLRE